MIKFQNMEAFKASEAIELGIYVVKNQPKLSVFGLGYVGAVTAVCFANLGHNVIGVDVDELKVDQMNSGTAPIKEPMLNQKLADALQRKYFKATTDAKKAIRNSDISLVSVCTPSHNNGSCNIGHLIEVAETIGNALKTKKAYHLILFRSTIPPGTTQDILIPIIEKASGKKNKVDFGVCFNPEFLRESTAIKDFTNPPKIVIGSHDKKAAKIASRLYEDMGGKVFICDTEVAEFIKYTDNSWHALKVSFANEIGRLCKVAKVDSREVMNIFCSDDKLNISKKYLTPGSAFGGSCLPKDVRAIQNLAEYYNLNLPIIKNIINSNQAHIDHITNLICKNRWLNIGFLGVSFKSGTDDLRESPVIAVIEQLIQRGKKILTHDVNLPENSNLNRLTDQNKFNLLTVNTVTALEVCEASDVIVVNHHLKQYQDLVESFSQEKIVVDLVGLNAKIRDSSLYQGICW